MKRTDLERHLRSHGCVVHREGGRHQIWINPANRQTAPVPRHPEIKTFTARSVCVDLGIPKPPGK